MVPRWRQPTWEGKDYIATAGLNLFRVQVSRAKKRWPLNESGEELCLLLPKSSGGCCLGIAKVGSETLQYERETLQHEEGNGAASEAHRQHGHGKIEDLCLAAYGDLIFVSVSDRFYNAGWVPVLCWVKYLGEEGESTPAAGVTFICSPWEMLRMLE
ncbi:uncharacterized protein LOC120661277 isoform X10 [Panicum virgatum]|uniref:uncharacterized protein LOC120661277 isoform X10 n=1 Tax=Panicum virgatum TaxID=38727 RepID=UPI0019D66DAF|nr:uncharacterized protein LOC120661277 isoform X10 [Panicum virgatum]XP_039796026.1 uncharacterized protein LOC120661277 isoform X10 [Panicum virgatum]